MIRGMCELTGKELKGEAYLRQCFKRILFTAKETILNYRDFGSDIGGILGSPQRLETFLNLYSESAQALEKWINGLKITGISLSPTDAENGNISLVVSCEFNEEDIKVEVNDGE